MKLTLTHTLAFRLGAPARAVAHALLTPMPTPQQKIEQWSIDMPGFDRAASFRDGFGNRAHLVSLTKPGDSLTITVTGTVETFDRAGVLGRLEHEPPPALYLRPTPAAALDETLIDAIPTGGGRIALLHELMGRVNARSGATQAQDGVTQSQSSDAPASQAQDGAARASDATALAHAFIGAARALDIPARYVAGYLCDEGAAALHAWAEAWDEGLGWIGFDPLLNFCPTDTHIRRATALDAPTTPALRLIPLPLSAPAETLTITAE